MKKNIEQVHALNLAFAATEQRLIDEISALVQREQQIAEQLLVLQREAEQEKAEQAGIHDEQVRTLQRQHAEREQVLNQQLIAGQQEFLLLERERLLRDKEHAEQSGQVQQELKDLLRTQVQREQQIAEKLLVLQQQAEQEKAEQAALHDEQVRTLQRQHAEREEVLNQQLIARQQELRNVQEARSMQEQALYEETFAKERELQAKLLAQHEEGDSLKVQIAKLEIENFASNRLEQELRALLETKLTLLAQAIGEISHIKKTRSWRWTAPLRRFFSAYASSDYTTTIAPEVGNHQILPLPLSILFGEKSHTFVSKFANNLSTHQDLIALSEIAHINDLLELTGDTFVHAAYQVILGRKPDPEGLAYYRARLRSGYGKVSVINQILSSPEAQVSKVQLFGLDELLKMYRRETHWFLGVFYRGRTVERQINRLEERCGALAEQISFTQSEIETRIAKIHFVPAIHKSAATNENDQSQSCNSSASIASGVSSLSKPNCIHGDVSVVGPYTGKKVAVLAPGSSLGTVGGAERFYSGLVKSLQEKGCDVELVCVTVDESNFERIQQGYKDFSELDLKKFDLVISTKAPTYVVNHSNHVLYLVHTVRVFYDMFDDVFPQADASIRAQRDWIHKEDSAAFSRIRHRFSIGTEVSRRLAQWNGCEAEVLHPPLDVEGLYDDGVGDYFYMPGRLHAWKRVDLAIRAIKHSSLPMRLVISGEGEAESALRDLAGDDPRIEFLGQVDDVTLKRLYAGALAVSFLPIREDYGYVTLEAFASGKPVITCIDSGEPTVFVEYGISGLVCRPEPQAVCAAFEQLWNDRLEAARMGRAGRERVAHINWHSVASRLLFAGFPEVKIPVVHAKKTLKVAVLDMQPIIPAVGGGRLRLLGLYHALGAEIEARYVGTYDWPGEKYRRHAITPTLEEIDVPLSAAHHNAAAEAACKAGGKTVIDMVFARQAQLSPEYLQETLDAVKWADVVVFSHPWVAPLVSDELLVNKTVVYDSHNVETTLRGQLLNGDNLFEQGVIDEVERAERSAGDRADLILACSMEDIDGFATLFGWERHKMRLTPNGVFSRLIQPAIASQKLEAKNIFGIPEDAFVGFFIGSNYAPNVEAALFIIEHLAVELTDVFFVIGGGVCSRLPKNLPANIRTIGFIEEQDKLRWLHASDFAINPMFSGSGTNIKMFDFMSAALPVVTTRVGARGIAQQSTAGLYLAEREELAQAVRQIKSSRQEAAVGGQDNRRIVEAQFAWESISPELGCIISSAHLRKQGIALMASRQATSRLRVAHLSTVGLKCGIGEYTRKIISIYQQHNIANLLLAGLAANEEPSLENVEFPASIVWYFDNVEWRHSTINPEALKAMLDWGATDLIVQYHPGFFSPEVLFDFVTNVLKHGIHVSVIVHNFSGECASIMQRLNDLGVLLFSHRSTEASQARALGVVLQVIPLGIDVGQHLQSKSIDGRDWYQNPPVIVTTGFLRRHKGVPILIRAMPYVLRHFPMAILHVRCALYSSDDSRDELELCKTEIDRLHLKNSVILDTGFVDQAEIASDLKKADIAVLPYESSNEGSSATAADCLAAGLPLVVSDAEIFDDIRNIALTALPDAQQVAAVILQVLSDPESYAFRAKQSISFARACSWETVAGTLLAASNNSYEISKGAE